MTIAICSSAHFYKQAVEIQEELEKESYNAVLPITAERMKASGNFDVDQYKTWFSDAGDYHKKAALMRGHFEKIASSDAILVLNYEKRGISNYIGGNVLMEMSLAFWLNKPIFVLNDQPEESIFLEEILGMMPVFLHGDVSNLTRVYEEITA